jgi:hypothetical protein
VFELYLFAKQRFQDPAVCIFRPREVRWLVRRSFSEKHKKLSLSAISSSTRIDYNLMVRWEPRLSHHHHSATNRLVIPRQTESCPQTRNGKIQSNFRSGIREQ